MKWFKILTVVLSVLVIIAMSVGCGGTKSIFPDKNLEAAIRDALGKPAGEEITVDDLAILRYLNAKARGITDLSGIEYCTNLTLLFLSDNQISDISPLSSLTNLDLLELASNQVSDISSLSSLTNLTWLNLHDNEISDISPLVENSGLGKNDEVRLTGNNLDLTEGSEDMLNIKALQDRGVEVYY